MVKLHLAVFKLNRHKHSSSGSRPALVPSHSRHLRTSVKKRQQISRESFPTPSVITLLLPHSLTANFPPCLLPSLTLSLPPSSLHQLFSRLVCACVCVSQVCKEAKAELVFLVDGSWSIGDDNFLKITRFLASTVGSLDLIGADGTQVGSHDYTQHYYHQQTNITVQ